MRGFVVLAIPVLLAAQDRSTEKEAALGAGLAKEYQRRMTVVEDDALNGYLARLAAQFRATIPAEMPTFRISVVANEPDGPMRAPTSLPGGYLIVSVRMIAEAPDEASFARLFAHAIAHIAGRHVALRRLPDADMDSIPLVFPNGFDGPLESRALVPKAALTMQEEWETAANARAEQMMQSFVPDARFASVQAEIQRLFPPRKAPSLRRDGEPVR